MNQQKLDYKREIIRGIDSYINDLLTVLPLTLNFEVNNKLSDNIYGLLKSKHFKFSNTIKNTFGALAG